MSKGTKISSWLFKAEGLPQPEAEYKFHPVRRWRFDYAWPDVRIALEIEGGIWMRGRHTRGAGYAGDMEKYNMAVVAGWSVLRYEPRKVDLKQVLELYLKKCKKY